MKVDHELLSIKFKYIFYYYRYIFYMKCGAVMLFMNPDPVNIYWKTDPKKIMQIRPELTLIRLYY